MSYIRVLPRDLFNEANFLKCVGALWIKLEGCEEAAFQQEAVEDFDLQQDQDGRLTTRTVTLGIRGETFIFLRPLNSREPWPLYVCPEEGWDETPVFNDDGTLHADFVALLKQGEA